MFQPLKLLVRFCTGFQLPFALSTTSACQCTSVAQLGGAWVVLLARYYVNRRAYYYYYYYYLGDIGYSFESNHEDSILILQRYKSTSNRLYHVYNTCLIEPRRWKKVMQRYVHFIKRYVQCFESISWIALFLCSSMSKNSNPCRNCIKLTHSWVIYT